MTEEQPYLAVRRESGFELRRYPDHVVAEVTVHTDFEDAGNRAFRDLFGYISGKNQSQQEIAMTSPVVQSPTAVKSQKIAMTAPVVQTPAAETGSHVVAFVLPASFTEQSAPVAESSAVHLRTVPESLVAAATYSGRWTQGSYDTHCAQLLADIAAASLRPIGPPRFARFDPPYKPWFLRRNEVLIDVAETPEPTEHTENTENTAARDA